MCMLNRRFDQLLDIFTTVSTKRSKVVDYGVISHEVNFLSNMLFDFISAILRLCQIASSGIPYHSFSAMVKNNKQQQHIQESIVKNMYEMAYDKLDLSKIPNRFPLNNHFRQFVNNEKHSHPHEQAMERHQ